MGSAEGRISGQYKIALMTLAREAMQQNDYERAEQLLNQALQYPENLGEGRWKEPRIMTFIMNLVWYRNI